MNDNDELEKVEALLDKGERLNRAVEKAQNELREFLQGEAKTRLQTTCQNFSELQKIVAERGWQLYRAIKK